MLIIVIEQNVNILVEYVMKQLKKINVKFVVDKKKKIIVVNLDVHYV